MKFTQNDLFGEEDIASSIEGDSIEEYARNWRASNCKDCQLGKEGRNAPVIYGGSPRANIVIVGEAPGAEEDQSGIPFKGKAGKLLDKILERAGLNRDLVYITNVSKCRPKGNRTPLLEELDICRPKLLKELELKDTVGKIKCIVTVGAVAAQSILSLKRPPAITKVVGEERQAQLLGRTIPVLLAYHTAFILRSPTLKEPLREVKREDQEVEIFKRAVEITRALSP
jgi:DNA polymerase